MAITCPENSTLCETMAGAGAGIGVFFEYLVIALPTLIITLAMIGAVVGVVYAIIFVIKRSVSGVHHR